MTIRKLIRLLEKAEKKIGPRANVTVDFSEVKAGMTGSDHSHWTLNCFDVATIPWAIDDSFELEDGSERMRTVVVLS